MTTTRALCAARAGDTMASAPTEAPANLRKSLRLMRCMAPRLFLSFQIGDVACDRVDLGVAITLGLAAHDGRGDFIVLEALELGRDVGGAERGETGDVPGTAPVRPVAGEATAREVACSVQGDDCGLARRRRSLRGVGQLERVLRLRRRFAAGQCRRHGTDTENNSSQLHASCLLQFPYGSL